MGFEFFQKKSLEKQISQAVVIVSKEMSHVKTIKERLVLKGITNIIELNIDPLSIHSKQIPADLWAVIIDAGHISNHLDYIDLCKKHFNKESARIIIGDNDSINLKNAFMLEGIMYLYKEAQLDQIYDRLAGFEEIKSYSNSTKISFIGCKGGIGTSTISYFFAKAIKQRYSTPVLCVQGANSSFNLDFISDVNFTKEYFSENGVNLYKQSSEDGNLDNKFKKFNFIVYDHSVQGYDKDAIEMILNESSCAVALIDKNPASIRKAKEVLRINEFLLTVNQGVRRLLVCLNETTKDGASSLSISNVQEILGANVDIVMPYSYLDSSKSYDKLPPKMQKSIINLSSTLVGDIQNNKKNFFSFLRK